MSGLRFGVFCALSCALPTTVESSGFLPDDSRYINVESYGANGSDGLDDTAAIQAAILDTLRTTGNSRYGASIPLYLPNGTYHISDTLEVRDPAGRFDFQWLSGFHLRGESESGVVLKVADNSSAFSNPASPTPVFITGSEGGQQGAGGVIDGSGNRAFRHYVENLTIDTGVGNPGAVGIDYLAHNRGAIENVTIRSSDPNRVGVAGIQMLRAWPGPALIKGVTIEGFDRAIESGQGQLSMVLEDITIRNQRVQGIYSDQNPLSIRNLRSENSVTAVVSDNRWNMVTLVDAELTGGAASSAAITRRGDVYLRNVQTQGYGTVADMSSRSSFSSIPASELVVPANPGVTTVDERVFENVLGNFDTPTGLNLSIRDTPTFHSFNPTDWVNVEDFGTSDDAAAFEAAFATGAPIVYAPRGSYNFNRTVEIPDTVKLLTGTQAGMNSVGALASSGGPIFRYVGDEGSTTLEHMSINGDVEHAGRGDLAIRKAEFDYYRNTEEGTGDMFFEDVIAVQIQMKEQRVFARQLNIEGNNMVLQGGAFVENDGGDFWVLGYKTEQTTDHPVLVSTNGGRNEILGGFFYNLAGTTSGGGFALIDLEESEFSGSFVTNGGDYETIVESTVDGATQRWGRGDNGALGFGSNGPEGGTLYWRGSGSLTPLFTINNVLPASGDINADAVFSAADYAAWRDGIGPRFELDHWRAGFGNAVAVAAIVPEPSGMTLMVLVVTANGGLRGLQRHR